MLAKEGPPTGVRALRLATAAILAFFGAASLAGAAHAVDSDSVQGKGKELKGDVEQKAGQVTGSPSLESKGQNDQSAGEAQNAWGKVKDAAKNVGDAIESKFGGSK
jgi:uncharacterized protein YjbJ (UPF0337 family)